jgi:hypothetical protein
MERRRLWRSDPGRLHVTEDVADILRKTKMFKLTDRGEMSVKGRGLHSSTSQLNLSSF